MKQTNIIVLSFIFLFLYSCKKGENTIKTTQEETKSIHLSPEEYQSIAFDHQKKLSDQETHNIVEKFITNRKIHKSDSKYKITISERNSVTLEKSTSDTEILSAENNIPVYKVAIEKDKLNDVAIVSADERYPVVIAYYTEHPDDKAENIGNKMLIDASIELLRNNIKKIEQNRTALRDITLEKISNQLSVKKEELNFDNIKNKIAIHQQPETKSTIITDPSTLGAPVASYGPYLPTAWSIGMPYNRLMAQSCPNNWLWDNRYAISSAVVATAQVLAAYQPSGSIGGQAMNWSYLTVNKEIHEDSDYFGSYVQDPIERRNMVATLLKGIGESCSVSYTCTGSSVNFNNIRNFLSARGIQTGTQQALNVPVIKTSIENLKPVIMYGQTSSNQGHWWVVDGTYITTGTQSYLPGFNFYIHANMGQGKSYLGYYLVGTDKSVTFDTSFAHFTTNFQMYPITTSL
ncbi:hypothetical protein DBR43_06430 [Pedobacter sp. KBW06]|uniref:C10 family peptidase n=1 Tax=Pedobacter sp. KBW06 TaxID=2153359 RepID=UPI000F5A0C54|nr:C10 family peptidase [Pedobacter sp. KBW06]RQO75007.1 hypothetical protein DBR43_06430 [Pedobacter sp. KBW06]